MAKIITVPKDQKAMVDLNHNIACNNQLIEWHLSESEYRAFIKLNLINFINAACDTLIDEFEDDNIPADKLNLLYDRIVKKYDKNDRTIKKLLYFIDEALKRNTLIWFFF